MQDCVTQPPTPGSPCSSPAVIPLVADWVDLCCTGPACSPKDPHELELPRLGVALKEKKKNRTRRQKNNEASMSNVKILVGSTKTNE